MGIRDKELDNINECIGKVLRNFRNQNYLTGRELAQLIGMSQQQISRYERGRCHITIPMLLKVLSVLQITTEVFFYQLAKNYKAPYVELYSKNHSPITKIWD